MCTGNRFPSSDVDSSSCRRVALPREYRTQARWFDSLFRLFTYITGRTREHYHIRSERIRVWNAPTETETEGVSSPSFKEGHRPETEEEEERSERNTAPHRPALPESSHYHTHNERIKARNALTETETDEAPLPSFEEGHQPETEEEEERSERNTAPHGPALPESSHTPTDPVEGDEETLHPDTEGEKGEEDDTLPTTDEMFALYPHRVRTINPEDDVQQRASAEKACDSYPLPDIRSMFALVHGDFTGDTFTPPTRQEAITYVHLFVGEMRRRGKESGVSDESLTELENRLSDILIADNLYDKYGDDYEGFGGEFMQLLREKKHIAIPSGYLCRGRGHLIFILFRMEEGKVSAEVINRGTGSEESIHTDVHGRKRVFAKKPLLPYPADTLDRHPFWRFFLDVLKQTGEDGSSAEISVRDVYDVLLPAWPGGTGDFHGKSYKPQYGGTCIFAGIKTIIREWIPEREAERFLSALSAHVLQEYATDLEVDGCLATTADGHLSRRILKREETDPEHRHALRKERELIPESNRAIRPQRTEPLPFASEPIRDENATTPLTLMPNMVSSSDKTDQYLRNLFRFSDEHEKDHSTSSPPSRVTLRNALSEIPETADDLTPADKALMCREIFTKIPSDDPLWASLEGRKLAEALHDDEQLLLAVNAIRVEEKSLLARRANELEHHLKMQLSLMHTIFACCAPADVDKVCALRHILTTIPPIDDPVWMTLEGGRAIELLQEVRESLCRLRRDSIDADEAALLFTFDMIRLRYALSLQKKYDNSATLCDFYATRMQDVFDSPQANLLQPVDPDITVKFTQAVAYLRSLERYAGKLPSEADLRAGLFFASIYDPVLDLHMPHFAYVRDIMSYNVKAGEAFTRWYEECENTSGRTSTGDEAKIIRAWSEFGNPYGSENLLKEVRQLADLVRLDNIWRDHHALFDGNRKDKNTASISRLALPMGEGVRFVECHVSEESESDYRHPFLATYPALNRRGEGVGSLKWLLSRRQPASLQPEIPEPLRAKFASQHERAGENGHLLHEQGITVGNRSLPSREVKGLFDCTANKELAIDTIISHFNRFPDCLCNPAFREMLLALLTQTHHSRKQEGKGGPRTKTCHLLLRAARDDPGQLLRLIEFAREAGERTEGRGVPDQVLFFFFIEGLSLAYFLRGQGDGKDADHPYKSFRKRALHLLGNATYRDATGSRLLALAPYFRNTPKRATFGTLTERVETFAQPDDPQEHLRVRYGELTVMHEPQSFATTGLYVVESPPFAGVYLESDRNLWLWSDPSSPIARASDLTYYVFHGHLHLTSPEESCNSGVESPKGMGPTFRSPPYDRCLFFYEGEKEPAYFYCGERGVEKLENGKPTGLFLARDYASTGACRFAKIAMHNDLFLWKDATGEVVLAEYRSSDLHFRRVGNKWMSSKHPGFFVDPDRRCPLFEPATHYLVLRNEEGRRIVYMPDRELKKPENPPELFGTPAIECEEGGSSLLVYRLTDEGEIDPTDVRPEELIYAFHLALRARNFTGMAHTIALLKRNAYPLNKRSVKFLCDAVEVRVSARDRHPKSVALKIRMILFALRDLEHLSCWEKEKLTEVLQNEMDDYLMQSNNVFPFALTGEERDSILRKLSGRKSVTEVTETIRRKPPDLSRHWGGLAMTPSNEPFPMPHIFRPTPLATRFIDYYRVARHFPKGSPMRKELALLLEGSVYETVPQVRVATTILEAVSANPDRFVTAAVLAKAAEDEHVLFDVLKQMWSQISPEKKNAKRRIRRRLHPPIYSPDPFLSLPPARPEGSPRAKRNPVGEEERHPPLIEGLPGVYATCPDLREEIETVSEIRTTLKRYLDTGTIDPVPDTEIDPETDTDTKKHEPCVAKEIEALIEGAEEMEKLLRKRQGEEVITIEPEKVPELQQAIALKVERADKDLETKREEILRLARTCPEEQREYVRGEMMTPLSLDKVIVAFGKEDDAYLLRENPFLTEEGLNTLKEKTEEYLLLHTERNRLAKSLEKLEQRRIEEATLILREKRAYEVRENPRFLVFEHLMGITLREEQIAFLRRLSPESPVPPSVLEEARTGFGKSKVAIPLWLSLRTSSGGLTFLTVPESLLEETRKQLSRILGDTFDTSLTMIEFSRSDLYDPDRLRSIENRLLWARKEGRVVLLSVGTLHALSVLAWKETLMKEGEGNPLPPENVAMMHRIRAILEHAYGFIDESSEALRPDFSYNYSFGKRCSVHRAHIEAITSVYESLLADDVSGGMAPDFLENAGGGRPLSEETYKQEVLPKLIDKILDRLNVSPEDRDIAEKSLKGGYDSTYERYFDTLGKEELERFATIREQLLVHLPASLSLRLNERYLLGEERISFPARYGTRIKGAQFSSIGLVLNCTIQANLKTSFTEEDLELFLKELRNLAHRESSETLHCAPGYEALQQLTGKDRPDLVFEREEKERLLHRLNTDRGCRLRFISSFVLPKFRYVPHTLTSYPQLIAERVAPTQGASGTLINTMPDALSLRFDGTAPFHNLIPLWQNSRDKVRAVSHAHGTALMGELLTGDGEEYNVIIDTAGCFRDMCDEEAARAILEETAGRNSPIDGVEYVEGSTGRRLVLKRNAATPVPRELCTIERERLFTFYAQQATIGLDIDLAEDSRALVTVGRHTEKNFFLQGVGRLRKLSAGMRASFVVPEEDMKEMKRQLQSDRSDFRFQDLFLYLVRKAGEKQGDDALSTLENEWYAEIERLFRHGTSKLPLWVRGTIFVDLAPLFLKDTFVSPLAGLRTTQEECSAEKAVVRKKEELLATLRTRIVDDPFLAKIYDLDTLSEHFDEKVKESNMRSRYVCNGGIRLGVTFTETEHTTTNNGLEVRESTHDRTDHATRDTLLFTPAVPVKFPTSTLPYTSMASYKPLETHIANGGLFRSPNFFHIASDREDIHKDLLKNARFVLLVGTRASNKYEMVLLDLYDAGHIKEDMREGRTPRDGERDFYLCTADNMKVIARNGDPLKEEPMAVENIRRLMIDGRLYTGHPVYDDKDSAIIRECCPSPGAFFDTLTTRFVPPFPHLAPHIEGFRKRVMNRKDPVERGEGAKKRKGEGDGDRQPDRAHSPTP